MDENMKRRIEGMISRINAEIVTLESDREYAAISMRREVARDPSGFGSHTVANLAQQIAKITNCNTGIERAQLELSHLNALIGRD